MARLRGRSARDQRLNAALPLWPLEDHHLRRRAAPGRCACPYGAHPHGARWRHQRRCLHSLRRTGPGAMPAAGRHRGHDNLATHKVAACQSPRRLSALPAGLLARSQPDRAGLRQAQGRAQKGRSIQGDPGLRSRRALEPGVSIRRIAEAIAHGCFRVPGADQRGSPQTHPRPAQAGRDHKQEEPRRSVRGFIHACKGRSPMRNPYAGSGGVCPAAISDPI